MSKVRADLTDGIWLLVVWGQTWFCFLTVSLPHTFVVLFVFFVVFIALLLFFDSAFAMYS